MPIPESASLIAQDGWSCVLPAESEYVIVGARLDGSIRGATTAFNESHPLVQGKNTGCPIAYDSAKGLFFTAVATEDGAATTIYTFSGDGSTSRWIADVPAGFWIAWLLACHEGRFLVANLVDPDASQQAIGVVDLTTGEFSTAALGDISRYAHLYSPHRKAILYGDLSGSSLSFVGLDGHTVPSALDGSGLRHIAATGVGVHHDGNTLALGGDAELTLVHLTPTTLRAQTIGGRALNPSFQPRTGTVWYLTDRATLACLSPGGAPQVVARLTREGYLVADDEYAHGPIDWSPDGELLTTRLTVRSATAESATSDLAGGNDLVKRIVVDTVRHRMWFVDDVFEAVALARQPLRHEGTHTT